MPARREAGCGTSSNRLLWDWRGAVPMNAPEARAKSSLRSPPDRAFGAAASVRFRYLIMISP
jgi:hypothetical protein